MTAFENIKHRILIVDDEPANIQLIAKILDKNEYNISYAEDGLTAIEMARHTTYDLILLDVIMPDMDGFAVCKMFQDDEELKDIPVIFLTARSDIEDVIQGFKIGAVDYVTKPFNDLELTARIRNHLELKSRRDTLRTELNFREKVMPEYAIHLEKRKKLAQAFIEFHFGELQESFQQRLIGKFENLTANEVRLSSYLRLNMSSKEISDITKQSIRALEAARSRLRKKLKLNSSVNLVSFLQRF